MDTEVRKNDPFRGKWSVRNDEDKIWVDASSLALGVTVEADGCVIENVSLLCKDDTTHIIMVELDSTI